MKLVNAGTTVRAAALEGHVRMLAETLVPRYFDRPRNLDRAVDYIAETFAAAGGRVERQVFVVGERKYQNVVARFGPEEGDRSIVGAHYDTAGALPGADDNASGVAGLLELARLIGKSPPAFPVELVAYTLEEPPYYDTRHMGSAVHAAALKRAGTAVRAMIALEMIGYFSDETDSQRYPLPGLSLLYPDRGHFIAVSGPYGSVGLVRSMKTAMAAAVSLPVRSINGPSFVPGVAALSDHMNYLREGFPAVMVTDTAFYRNPNYHLPSDTAETLDYLRMAQVVEGVHAAVRALGG